MNKLLKNACFHILLVILCATIISGCSSKLENVEKPEPEQTKRFEIEIQTNDTIESVKEIDVDLSSSFKGINGCAVLFNPEDNQYSFYNKDISEKEFSPYSTFKIISTLIGLQNGIIDNEMSTMNYNGTQYPVAEWNDNLTLQEAFRSSCIWYFRQIIDAVGKEEVEEEIANLEYGNCDISDWNGNNTNPIEELNGFWLNSSLKISPLEQVQIMAKIFEGESIYGEDTVNVLKNIMLVNDNGIQKIYGKTGSGSNGEAWFVGFSEENYEREYFAIYLDGGIQSQTVSGNTAKEIALEIIK